MALDSFSGILFHCGIHFKKSHQNRMYNFCTTDVIDKVISSLVGVSIPPASLVQPTRYPYKIGNFFILGLRVKSPTGQG